VYGDENFGMDGISDKVKRGANFFGVISAADPPDRGLHRTQARQTRVPCDIGPQYRIISTVMIPVVSSGAT